MSIRTISSPATSLLLAALAAGPASAAISLPGGDVLLDGSFSQATYGLDGRMNITPLLFSSDLAQIDSPAAVVVGTDLSYSYNSAFSLAESVFTLTYTISNDALATDPFNDLRFFVNVRAKGQPGFNDSVGAGLPAGTDPDSFQVFDGGVAPPVLDRILSAANLNGSTQGTCGAPATGCFTELALQWNRASLAPGESWQIQLMLVDDPALVTGGRYLAAQSLGPNGQQLFMGNPTLVPEPETYALMLAGFGLLSWMRLRRRGLA
jgi:hypothetical protein